MSKSLLSEKWLWIIILAIIAIITTPLLVVYVILMLEFPYNTIATIALVAVWGVVAGYKDWIISKRKDEKQKPES